MSINRPRSAQINDRKQHYTVLPALITGSVADYPSLKTNTVTKTYGGAAEASPAVLRLPNQGPYALAPGNTFTIQLPGVNGDFPVSVVIQGSDIVFGQVTTATLAARINASTLPYTPFTIATVEYGRVVLTSHNISGKTFGASASVTITCSTNLFEYFGYAPGVVSVTENGADAFTRGIVTKTPDGKGGRLLFKATSLTPGRGRNNASYIANPLAISAVKSGAGSRATELFDVWRYVRNTVSTVVFNKYFVDPGDGGEITGYLTRVGDNDARINLVRNGQTKPVIRTSNNNPSTLNLITAGDSFTIQFSNTLVTTPYSYTYTFSGAVSSVSNLITTLNDNFVSDNGSFAQVFTDRSGPYQIPNGSFTIRFGESAPLIEVYFNSVSGVTNFSADSLVSYINNFINYFAPGSGTAGKIIVPSDPGRNLGSYEAVFIRSSSSDHVNTYVDISAGRQSFPTTPPFVATSGTFLSVLDALGIKPGIYGAGYLVEPHGSDEIAFVSHAREPGSSISITGNPSTLSRLGIASGTISYSILGEETIRVSESFVMAPEVMTLGEIPADVDQVYSSFQMRGKQDPIPPFEGIKNVANNPNSNPLGTNLDSSRPFLGGLSLNTVALGQNLTGSSSDLLRARTTAYSNSDLGWTLLYVVDSAGGVASNIRMYVNQSQELYLTYNCFYSGSQWQKDSGGFAYRTKLPITDSFFEFNESDNVFAEGSWKKWFNFGETGSGTSLLEIETSLDNSTNGKTIFRGIFDALIDSFSGTQRLSHYSTSVTTGALRTAIHSKGYSISFNADVTHASGDFVITKDVSGPSWILFFQSGNSDTSGVSLYYEESTNLSRVLTNYTEIFSTANNHFRLGKSIKVTDELLQNNIPLFSQTIYSYNNPLRYFYVQGDFGKNTGRTIDSEGYDILYKNYEFKSDGTIVPSQPADKYYTRPTYIYNASYYGRYYDALSMDIKTDPSSSYNVTFKESITSTFTGHTSKYTYDGTLLTPNHSTIGVNGGSRFYDKEILWYDNSESISVATRFNDYYFVGYKLSRLSPVDSDYNPIRIRTLNSFYANPTWSGAGYPSTMVVEHLDGIRILQMSAGSFQQEQNWKPAANFDTRTALAFKLTALISKSSGNFNVTIYDIYNIDPASISYGGAFGNGMSFRIGNEVPIQWKNGVPDVEAAPFTAMVDSPFTVVNGSIQAQLAHVFLYEKLSNLFSISTQYSSLSSYGFNPFNYNPSSTDSANIVLRIIGFGIKKHDVWPIP